MLPGDFKAGVFQTSLARIGIAMCYEHFEWFAPNYLDLLSEEELHCALWVSPSWLESAIEYTAKYVALRNNTWVAVACQVDPVDKEEQEDRLDFNIGYSLAGGSGVVNPDGEYIAGPVLNEEAVIYAEIELNFKSKLLAIEGKRRLKLLSELLNFKS